MPVAPIIVLTKRMDPAELRKLVGNPFPGMVKFVVDIDRKVIAVGGQLHVDAEQVLLERECQQESLWGGNYWPGLGEEECIEYTSLINLRPAQNNLSILVQDPKRQARIRAVVFELLGHGEPLT